MRDPDPGKPRRAVRRTLAAASEEARRLRSLLEILPTPMLIVDRGSALVDGNERFRSCFALSRARIRRMQLADLAAEGGAGAPLRRLAEELASDEPLTSVSDAWCRHGDGKRRRFCRIAATPLAESRGTRFVVAFEERTALRERCDELEARWSAAFQVANVLEEAVLVGSDDLRSLAYGNSAVERVLGIAPGVLRATPRSLLSAIHPDDKATVAALVAGRLPAAARVRLSSAGGSGVRCLRLRFVRLGDAAAPHRVALLATDESAQIEAAAVADELARASTEVTGRLRSLAGSIAPRPAADDGPMPPPADGVQIEFAQRLETLSPREREVLELLVEGRSTKQICAALGLQPSTVGVHRATLVRKLGVKNSAALLRRLVFAKATRRNL